MLEQWQSEVLDWLQEWVEKFSHVSSSDSSRFGWGWEREKKGEMRRWEEGDERGDDGVGKTKERKGSNKNRI